MMVGTIVYISVSFQANNKAITPIFYSVSTFLGIYMVFSYVLMIYSVIEVILAEKTKAGLSGHISVGWLQGLIYVTMVGYALPVAF